VVRPSFTHGTWDGEAPSEIDPADVFAASWEAERFPAEIEAVAEGRR
jgi:hypothetical protein